MYFMYFVAQQALTDLMFYCFRFLIFQFQVYRWSLSLGDENLNIQNLQYLLRLFTFLIICLDLGEPPNFSFVSQAVKTWEPLLLSYADDTLLLTFLH